ncbi:interleukin-15-like isoform X2 [Rana temporaria]|uniref:interleukin-15-like isoform X2 n=1 Tax=Rana temporaria TaxID=8407 RepID=UPI001AADBAE6|nr:interleukin-15-like isoform X2 [Rana temporaria]
MYHWTVPTISIILIFSYAIPGWCNGIRRRWMAIGDDLKHVYDILQKSKYWNYDTCRKSILHCYVQELKAVVEEVTLIGDEDAAEEITQKIYNIETNGNITFMEEDSCKTCEEYEEKDLEEFIKGFETLTQQMLSLLLRTHDRSKKTATMMT